MSNIQSSIEKPTIVLVHGAFAESSSFNGVISKLLDEGYPVLAAANPLRGVKADADYLSSVLDGVEGPIVLAGHSYGGTVMTNAATGKDRVTALVYIAGFAPDQGESAADLSGRYPGGTLGETLVAFQLPDGGTDLYIDQDKYRDQFAHDVPEADSALMGATQRPIAEAALGEESGAPAWKSIPSWFLYGTGDKNIPLAAQRFMAERAAARSAVEIEGASHALPASQAGAVAELISEAAMAPQPEGSRAAS